MINSIPDHNGFDTVRRVGAKGLNGGFYFVQLKAVRN